MSKKRVPNRSDRSKHRKPRKRRNPLYFLSLFYTFLNYFLYLTTTDKGKNNKTPLLTIFGKVPEFPEFPAFPAIRIGG